MKTTLALFVILLVILVFPGFTFNPSLYDARGNGNITREDRPVHSFSVVVVNSGINLYLIQGQTEKVIVETDENLQSLIVTDVKDGMLNISFRKSVRSSHKSNVYVTFSALNVLKGNGGSDIFTEKPLHLDKLSASLNGGSDLHLEGDFKSLEIEVNGGSDAVVKGHSENADFLANGGSDINAGELTVNNCSVVANGGSDAWVNVSDKISVKALGGSDVHFSGNAVVLSSEVRGGSDLKKKP
ncbi:MAG: head GIN domain-containing protein [Bacteroidales bacterium]